MNVLDAARLMETCYGRPEPENGDLFYDVDLVQVHYKAKSRALVIEGTNEPEDWFIYNFNLIVMKEPKQGDSNAWYHAGFLNHAQMVYGFAKSMKDQIDVVIGHSLGAASAQIVGPSLGKTTVAFASPKPLLRGDPVRPELVTTFNRTDDFVCEVPPGLFGGAIGYAHIGKVHWMEPRGINLGEDHRIDKYIDLLKGHHADKGRMEIVVE